MAVSRKLFLSMIAAVAMLLANSSRATAQGATGSITGSVVDSASRQPLANVAISVGNRITRTGDNGQFNLTNVPAGPQTLRAVRIGYRAVTQSVTVGMGADAAARVQIAMVAQAVALTEMVVTGYGEQRAASLTGSVQKVGETEFNRGRIVSPEQLVAGKVPGVQIVDTGEPGGGISIRIRGGSSVTSSNEPLFVVDGVPLTVGGGLSSGRNPLNFLNPSDIESITVLKDASATAIYGSRGANGVLIIETKRGGGGNHMSYTGSISGSQVVKTADMLSLQQFRDAIAAQAPENVATIGNATTDWTDLIQQSAVGQDHNLAFSGGAGTGRYRISAGYLDQKGIIEASDTRRLSGSVNYDQRLFADRLSVRASLKGSRADDRFTPGGVVGSAYAFAPTQPVIDASGANAGYFQWVDPRGPANPIALLNLNTDDGRTTRSVGDLEAKYQMPFLEDLFGTLRLGYDVVNAEREIFSPTALRLTTTSRLEKRNNSFSSPLLDAFLNYVRPFGASSNIDITGGYSYQSTRADNTSFVATGLSFDLLGPNGVPSAQTTQTFLNIEESKLASFFGRVNYAMNDRYFVTLAVRRDGSSKFGADNQWGWFPSAAVAWRIASPGIISAVPGLSDLKLRASWGMNGNQEFGNYRAFSDYVIGDAGSQALFGNTYVATIRPSASDPAIKWEETTSTNFGFDYGFWGGRINGSADYYYKKTNDLIFNVPVAAGTNLSNFVTTNIGSLKNKGFEFSLNAQVLQGGVDGINWNMNWNASTNSNRLLSINSVGTGDEKISVGGISGGVGVNIQVLQPGHPINSFHVYRHKRGANGLPIYEDANNDNTINEQDLYEDVTGDGNVTQDDRVAFHSPAPKWILGHTSYATWRNLDFGFTLRANLGSYVYNNVASNQGYYSALKGPAPNNLHASVLETNFMNPQYFSDYYVEDASFLRLDNITLGYTIKSMRIPEGTRLFGSAQNLFTMTRYSGVDPLAGINGIDNNIYPRARTFTAGVTVGF